MTIDLQNTLGHSEKSAIVHIDFLCMRKEALQALMFASSEKTVENSICQLNRLKRILNLYNQLTIRMIREIHAILEERNFSYFSMVDLEETLFSKSGNQTRKEGEPNDKAYLTP